MIPTSPGSLLLRTSKICSGSLVIFGTCIARFLPVPSWSCGLLGLCAFSMLARVSISFVVTNPMEEQIHITAWCSQEDRRIYARVFPLSQFFDGLVYFQSELLTFQCLRLLCLRSKHQGHFDHPNHVKASAYRFSRSPMPNAVSPVVAFEVHIIVYVPGIQIS